MSSPQTSLQVPQSAVQSSTQKLSLQRSTQSSPDGNALSHLYPVHRPEEDSRPNQRTQSAIATSVPVLFCLLPVMGHIPKILRFTGEGRSVGESFQEWHEHFENVARLTGWDDQWKLAHLTSNLGESALAYYRSCSPEVRNQYPALVSALERKFAPVRLTAVQVQLFHTRQQQERENVDQFAQELQKLYNLAYGGATGEGPQAERMGQTLLTNHFVNGLRQHFKQKLIGVEGSFEEMVLKARFEEAKTKEFVTETPCNAASSRTPRPPISAIPTSATEQLPVTTSLATNNVDTPRTRGGPKCYACGLEGHINKNFPYPRDRQNSESKGRRSETPQTTVSALVGEKDTADQMSKLAERLEKLEKQFPSKTATMNTVTAESKRSTLGPRITSPIHVNGQPTQALIDTGSPATVISLDFVLDTFVKKKRWEQSPSEWREVSKKFSLPSIVHKAYSGHSLDIQYQLQVELTSGDQTVNTMVLVQENAPHNLLLWMDLQSQLGFALVKPKGTKLMDLLTGKEHSCPTLDVNCIKDPSLDGEPSSSLPQDSQPRPEPSSAGGRSADNHQAQHRETQQETQPVDQTGVVRLLTAVRSAPWLYEDFENSSIWRAQRITTPVHTNTNKPQIALAEAAICRGEDSQVVMVISNQGEETVHMPKGEILGTVMEAEIKETSVEGLVCSLDEESSGNGTQGDANKQESKQPALGSMDRDRVNRLMEQIGTRSETLHPQRNKTTSTVDHLLRRHIRSRSK